MGATATFDAAEIAESRSDKVSFRNWIAVLGALLGAFMAVLDIQITNSSLQDITGGIGATLDEGSWVSIAYLVPEIIVIPLCGWLARVFGLRRYLMVNSALFLFFSICCGFAWNLQSMIVFRALQGFTGGALIPMASALVLSMLPTSKQAVGFALFGITATFAPAIGPTIGGWITDNYGWPWIFYLNLVPGGLLIAALGWGLPKSTSKLDLLKKGDWTGILFMALGLGALTVMLEEGTREDWFGSSMIVTLTVIAAIALPAFVLVQLFKKRGEPLLNLRLFQRRNFLLGCTINLVLGLALYGVMYLLPLYLAQIQGYNALQIGETMMWVGMPQLLIMPLVPMLMKRVDSRILIGIGLTAFALSCLWMSNLSADSAHDQMILPQLTRAFGFPFIMVPLSMITTGGVESANVASASGLFNMLRNLGGSIGIALSSALLTQREHFHSNHLGEAISLYNPLTTERLDTLTQTLTTQGLDAATAHDRAIAMLDLVVRKQSYLLAYNDTFHAMMIVLLISVPLVFLCKKVASGHATGGAH